VDLRRLRVLLELSRLGTMRAVADRLQYGTSAVSQQVAALEREVGTALIEPYGRRVRLTPAGRRLAEHAERILAAVAAAEADLSDDAAPHGDLRVAGYSTALRRWLLPVAAEIRRSHSRVRLELQEREPTEVRQLLAHDLIDVGLIYDYSLVPAGDEESRTLLWTTPMVLAVPADDLPLDAISTASDLAVLRGRSWICNSRGRDDDELASRLCGLDGWRPNIRHRADSLELVIDMIAGGHGVAVVPADAPKVAGVRQVPIFAVTAERRTWSLTKPGRERWPATTLLLEHLTQHLHRQQPGPAASL
jgi:DNA-binding transcriptional LysR family regulator